MMLKYVIALVIVIVLAAVFAWAFLPGRHLPGNRARHLRIRLHLRLHPGKGFAHLFSLWLRWSRFAVLRRSGQIRPALPWRYSLLDPGEHSVLLGRAHYRHQLRVPLEEHLLVLAPPRTYKTAFLADVILRYPGPVIATTTKADVYQLTSAVRAERGRVHVFNPQHIGGVPSTFCWDPVAGCEDPATAIRRADAFAFAVSQKGVEDGTFWSAKASDYLRGYFHADEGHSGATLARPGLEALRDLAAQGCLDVVLVYSPDRLARKFACQALLIEELARCGARVEFVKGPRGDSPEDQLLVQFQGMFAEYEKAQLMERYRRGKAWRARTGSVNVLSGAPFGYRYIRKTPECGARYEIVPHEAVLVTEMFRRYADDGASIADLRRWLTDLGVRTRTGKERWDRSVIWGMLRNPAYAGTAVFGKTQAVHEPAGLNRTARLAGRTVPRQVRVQDRPREEWTAIPVPALVDEETFERVQQRLEDNKRFASRNTRVPSLLQGLAACASCGYGYYRTSTTTTAGNKIYYYRCLGSDDYRYQGGRICSNKPVRASYVDEVVWDHVTGLLADPSLIRAEIDRRLERARTSDPVTRKRGQLGQALAKTSTSIAAMVTAFSEQLITIDELRARMPDLRARETGLKDQIDALDAQAADRGAYLKLADDLEGFLARLRASSATATTQDRQRVLRAVVQDVLIGPDKLTIRHRIPARQPSGGRGGHDTTDTEGDMRNSSLLRWGRVQPRHV